MREPSRPSQVVTSITPLASVERLESSAWQDPAPTTRLARGSVPPADVSVTFVRPSRKPTTLQMAVPPMPESRPSTNAIEPSASRSGRAGRTSDLDALVDTTGGDAVPSATGSVPTMPPPAQPQAAPVQRSWARRLIAVALPAAALGAIAAYLMTDRTGTEALPTAAAPPVAVVVGAVDHGDGAAIAELQASRERLAAEISVLDRAIADDLTSADELRDLRTLVEQRRGELARARKAAAEVGALVAAAAPQRDPFANSTRSDVGTSVSPALAARYTELERRAGKLGGELRAFEASLALRTESAGEVAKSVDERDTLAVRLAALDRALDALRTAVNDRVLAQVALDPVPEMGTHVFACRAGTTECRDAGEVVAVRGRLVELRLDRPTATATASDTLYLGATP